MGEIGGFIGLVLGGSMAWIIGSYFKQKIYEKQRTNIIAKQQRDYDASMVRLKNMNYLTALARHDSLAKKLLKERINGDVEHYAERPQ